MLEVVGEYVFIFGHIQSEIIACFEIVEICVSVGILFGYVIEEFLALRTLEKFAYGRKGVIVPQINFGFSVRLQRFERLFKSFEKK